MIWVVHSMGGKSDNKLYIIVSIVPVIWVVHSMGGKSDNEL